MKILSGLLIVAICCLSLSVPAIAQTSQTKQEQQTQKVKEKIKKLGLGERVKVKVKLYNDTTFQGYVKEANEDAFVVIDKLGNPNTAKYSEVKSVGGKNLSTGAKIGIGIGIGAGAVLLIIAALIWSLDD
jgi:hypothetical protein